MVLLDTTDLKTFCVFLNKTTHDFNIYLIFEKYPYYLPRHDLLNPYYKTCRGR